MNGIQQVMKIKNTFTEFVKYNKVYAKTIKIVNAISKDKQGKCMH